MTRGMARKASTGNAEPGAAPQAPPPEFDPAIHKLTKYEGFVSKVIHRSQINPATYNPRLITDKARGRLKEGIETVKLVSPLTWNERTGNLIAGHQRLSCIDSLEHKRDYWLTVARVDVDEETERELNILLNNPNAQGDWDLEKLNALMTQQQDLVRTLRPEATGFGADDMYTLFGHQAFHGEEGATKLDALADKLREKREAHEQVVNTAKASKEANAGRTLGEDYIAVIVFRNGEDRDDFMREIYGFGTTEDEESRFRIFRAQHWYLDGRDLRRIFRARTAESEPEPEDDSVTN